MAVTALEPDDEGWGEFRTEIDRRLNELRPARSTPADRAWMQPIFGWCRNHMPNESNLVRYVAEQEVIKREARANRKANRLLKAHADGQAPLTWADLGPLPFTMEDNGLRVRFDAATPDETETRSNQIRLSARRSYQSGLRVADVLDELARRAREAGYDHIAMIGDLPIRDDGRLADLGWDDEEDDE